MGNCVEVCKVTLRYTPCMGPSPQHHKQDTNSNPQPTAQPMEATPLNPYHRPPIPTANGSFR